MNISISKDNCLFYGMPGICILAISFVVSMNIAKDFDGSTFVSIISFFGCNFSIWMMYLLIFLHFPMDVVNALHKKEVEESVEEEEMAASSYEQQELQELELQEQEMEEQESFENDAPTAQPITVEAIVDNTSDTPPSRIDRDALLRDEEYEQRKTNYDNMCELHRKQLLQTLMDYTRCMMSPFLSQDDVTLLCEQILEWADNPEYNPVGIQSVKKLTTYDLRHYVWNISERFDSREYNCTLRAEFAKKLFPHTMRNIEIASLKNMRERHDVGIIKIDQPEPGSFEFHSMSPFLPVNEKVA